MINPIDWVKWQVIGPLDKAAALRFINEQRARQGCTPICKLKPGDLRNKRHCPLAVSLEAKEMVKVGHGYVEYMIQGTAHTARYKIPKRVRRFIKNFDAGKYPELIKEEDGGAD